MATEQELERIVVRFMGDAQQYIDELRRAQSQTSQAARDIQTAGGQIEGFFDTLKQGAMTMLGVAGITSAAASLFKSVGLAAEAEKNEIAFGTMLKSMEAGKQMVADLQKFAATTPLNTADVQQATKTLLQFGVAGNDIIPTLRMLGDATGGDAMRFNMLALSFGQMTAAGRLMGQDLLQMINAGFNPLQEMVRTTGKSMAELKQKMEKGEISVKMVREAFAAATSEGGAFFGMMEKQSKSVSGLFSTMQDDIDAFLRVVGQDLIKGLGLKDVMQGVCSAAQFLGQTLRETSDPVKILTIALGATGLAYAMGLAGMAATALGAAWGFLGGIVGILTLGAAALGVALYALPLVAVAAGAYYLFDAITGLSSAQSEYNKVLGATASLNAAVASSMQRQTSRTLQEAQGIESPGDRRQFLQGQADKATTEVHGLEKSVTNAQQKVDDLTNSWARFLNPQEQLAGNPSLREANALLEQQKMLLDEAKKQQAALNAEIKKLDPTEQIKKAQENIQKLTEKLQEQIPVIGMSTEQAAIFKAQQAGLSEAALANARGLAKMKEEAESAHKAKKKLNDEIASLTNHLEMEILTFGMTSEAAKIFKLEMQGASGAEIENAKGLQLMHKYLEDNKKAMEEGKKVTEKVRTPLEKFADEQTKLQKLLDKGAITEETFGRAMEQAEKDLNKAEMGAKKAHTEISKFDTALAGSAEAQSRISSYFDAIRFGFEEVQAGASPIAKGSAPKQFEGVQRKSAEAVTRQEKSEGLLTDIRDVLKSISQKPTNIFEPVGIEE